MDFSLIKGDSITLGGRVITDLENLVVLYARNGGGVYSTLRDSNGDPYQVPVGKEFRVVGLKASNSETSSCNLGYGDNNVGTDSAVAPTNKIVIPDFEIRLYNIGIHDLDITTIMPAEKYPYYYGYVGTNTVIVYGYEV